MHVRYLHTTRFPLLTKSIDPTCVLLGPRRDHRTTPISPGMYLHILNCLTLWFKKTAAVVRKAIPIERIVQWGKVQRLDGGDLMQTSELVRKQKDSRDNTFVRVSRVFFWMRITE